MHKKFDKNSSGSLNTHQPSASTRKTSRAAMGHLRKRFNAKARQSTAGSKKRKRTRLEDADTKLEAETQRDTNAEIIELKTKEQKESLMTQVSKTYCSLHPDVQ